MEGQIDIFRDAEWGATREELEALVEGGADFRKLIELDQSILHCAAKGGNRQAIAYFISKGMEVEAKDTFGKTPLMAAAAICLHPRFVAVVKLFMENGADLNAEDNLGRNLLMATTRFEAPVATLEELVRLGAVMRTTQCSVLHVAAEVGYLGALEYFIENGGDVNWRDGYGATPLMYALSAKEKFVAVAEALVNWGADPHLGAEMWNTVLHLAAREGNVEGVKFFLAKGVDVDVRNRGGWTPLMCAPRAGANFEEVATVLLENGADITAKPALWELSIVHLAADAGNLDALRFLLEWGENVDIRDDRGATPLLFAVRNTDEKWAETVEFLVGAGADVKAQDNLGNNAVLLAVKGGRAVAEVKKLVELGCLWWLPNGKGQTAVKKATETNDPDLLVYFQSLKTEENEEWFQ